MINAEEAQAIIDATREDVFVRIRSDYKNQGGNPSAKSDESFTISKSALEALLTQAGFRPQTLNKWIEDRKADRVLMPSPADEILKINVANFIEYLRGPKSPGVESGNDSEPVVDAVIAEIVKSEERLARLARDLYTGEDKPTAIKIEFADLFTKFHAKYLDAARQMQEPVAGYMTAQEPEEVQRAQQEELDRFVAATAPADFGQFVSKYTPYPEVPATSGMRGLVRSVSRGGGVFKKEVEYTTARKAYLDEVSQLMVAYPNVMLSLISSNDFTSSSLMRIIQDSNAEIADMRRRTDLSEEEQLSVDATVELINRLGALHFKLLALEDAADDLLAAKNLKTKVGFDKVLDDMSTKRREVAKQYAPGPVQHRVDPHGRRMLAARQSIVAGMQQAREERVARYERDEAARGERNLSEAVDLLKSLFRGMRAGVAGEPLKDEHYEKILRVFFGTNMDDDVVDKLKVALRDMPRQLAMVASTSRLLHGTDAAEQRVASMRGLARHQLETADDTMANDAQAAMSVLVEICKRVKREKMQGQPEGRIQSELTRLEAEVKLDQISYNYNAWLPKLAIVRAFSNFFKNKPDVPVTNNHFKLIFDAYFYSEFNSGRIEEIIPKIQAEINKRTEAGQTVEPDMKKGCLFVADVCAAVKMQISPKDATANKALDEKNKGRIMRTMTEDGWRQVRASLSPYEQQRLARIRELALQSARTEKPDI